MAYGVLKGSVVKKALRLLLSFELWIGVALVAALPGLVHAQEPTVSKEAIPAVKATTKPVIALQRVLDLARIAISEESIAINQAMEGLKEKRPGLKRHDLKTNAKTFAKYGIGKIDPEYPLEKCLLNADDFVNLMSPTLTLKDDDTYGKKSALTDLDELYGRKFYKVIYNICNRAKVRFEKRLAEVQFEGSSFRLSKDDQKRLVRLVFFPTIEGKPNIFQEFQNRDVGFAVLAFAASSTAAFGLVLPGVILTVIYVIDDGFNLFQSIRRQNPSLYLLKMPELAVGESAGGLVAILSTKELELLKTLDPPIDPPKTE